MATEAMQAISNGPYTETISRMFGDAMGAAIEEVNYLEVLGEIDELAADSLRRGIRTALKREAKRYSSDGNFTRRSLPDDGESAKMIAGLRSRYQAERRETQRSIAYDTLTR